MPPKGWKVVHSEETRKKISEAVKAAYASGKCRKPADYKAKGFTGKHTDETKDKISQNRTGKGLGNCHGFAKGHEPHNKGKSHPVHTPEWRAKVSAAHSGPNHWNWKGGINAQNRLMRNSTKHKEWMLAVFANDRWTCRTCGYKGRFLVAHHVIQWSEDVSLRFDVSNGITLCRSCHCAFHKPRTGTGKSPKPQSS